MRIIANQIRYDDRIDGFTVQEYIHILDGNPPDDPRVVLIRLERVKDNGDRETRTMWFAGGVEVDVAQSPYRHSEDDNVDSNLREHSR